LSLAAEQNYREAYNNLGCLFFELNMFADSQTYYQKAIDAGDIEAYSNLGLLHYKNNEFDKAEQMYLKAIDLGSAKALFNLAVLYHNQKRYNEAELNYLKAIKKIRQAQTFFLELLRDGGDTVAICLPIVFLAQLYFGGLKQETKAIELLKANSWPKDKIELFLNF
jgi:tetratricopeptide (TPR) repeat protein